VASTLAFVRLYIVRHATAESRETPGLDDADRRLVEQGRTESRLAAQAMARMDARPARVVTSPLRRAVETARPIAAMLDVPLEQDRLLRPGFDEAAFAAVTDRHGNEDLALVGHEPDLSELVGYLTGAHVALPKGAIARIDVTTLRPGVSELRWLLRPKQIRLIATTRVTA
jgi:phosphohistidine phosphatase